MQCSFKNGLYHIIFHYIIVYHVVLYYVLYGGWPGSTRPKATVIAPKSNQHRDPNHIRKPTSYIMNTLSRTSPKNTKVLESSKSYIVNTLLYLHPRTCQNSKLQAPSTRARRSRARQRCPCRRTRRSSASSRRLRSSRVWNSMSGV